MSDPGKPTNLRRLVERLADRGTPRGASTVMAEARSAATRSSRRPVWMPVAAVAASVALLAGIAIAVEQRSSDQPEHLAGIGPSTTLAEATDGTAAPTNTTPTTTSTTNTTDTTTGKATSPTTSAGSPTTKATAKPATPSKGGGSVKAAAVRLQSFNDCSGFISTVKSQALQVVGPYGLPGTAGPMAFGGTKTATPARETAGAPTASPTTTPTPDDTSTTNVQEAGVDEPDTVKTDGNTIFSISNGKVWAVAARGAPRVLGSLTVEGNEAFLVGSKLLVLGNGAYMYARPAGGRMAFAPMYGGSTIAVVDVSNPAAMRVTSKMSVDGSYVAARAVDGVARIVVRTGPNGLDFEYPQDGTKQAQDQATAHNRGVVRSSSLTNWSPHVTVTDGGGRTTRQGTLLSCGAAYRPPQLAGFGMLTVITLDPSDPARSASTSVMADGDMVYASTGRLYVATNQWGRIVDAQTVEPSTSTLIHAFDISNRTNARYLMSGSVRGTVLNQFSFSEYQGKLRVATTDQSSGGSQSFMTVLADGPGTLVTVGQLGGLGQGERIYAVRFIGDTGYVVTFKQVDPLHVIDLSDPAHPRLAGELHIEGYSAYLHPVGDNLLLGVGQDVSSDGRRAGTQVSLFDVSNPANPKRLQHASLGTAGSSSPAEFDHHAFLWWAPTKLAVLPLSQYDQTRPFNGAVGMRVTPQSLTEAGRVQHPASQQSGQVAQSPAIERSLVVGGRLFTVSYAGVLASDLATLQDQAWVPFPQPQPQPSPSPAPQPQTKG